jgi:hypothetical protein
MPRTRATAWLLAAAVLVPLACGDMRQDELDCEEAVSHLQECCPSFDSSHIECLYVSGCETSTYPAISIAQSQCIRGESCATLVSSGVCTRAQGVWPVQADADDTGAAAVCP